MNLDERLALIETRLAIEERHGPVEGLTDLIGRIEERREIASQLSLLEREWRPLASRYKRLPALPSLRQVRWAQSVLAFADTCILSIDNDSTTPSPAILRLLVLDTNRVVRFDRPVAPGFALADSQMKALGITPSDLRGAPSLPQVWPSFMEALRGKYIVSYNLAPLLRVLEDNAKQYDLDPPVIIGGCLLRHCLHYFQDSGFANLVSLCRLVGYPLPEPPDQTAVDRALGQLRLLQAMSSGITGWGQRPSSTRVAPEDLEDDLKDDLFAY